MHSDQLAFLNSDAPLRDKLLEAHRQLQARLPFIARIAVALYDPATCVLKTYLHSSGEDNPLQNYQAHIDEAPSLKNLLEKGHPRVINNMVTFEDGKHEHTRRIGRQGYTASYTLPLFHQGRATGFLFFNSYQPDVFTEDTLRQLDLYGHLISLMVLEEINAGQVLAAAVRATGRITHTRDPETGTHLDRMSRYARLIARELAEEHQLDDQYIEHLFMFAPLHDIGKIAIPDNILRKPGKLDEDEWRVMQTHSAKGREMIDELLDNFDLGGLEHARLLRNIAQFHHEAVNGSGYPNGLSGDDIPLEARIVAVADVFDALTSERPYKKAWSNDEAFAMLRKLAGETLDAACVGALLDQRAEVEEIQRRFEEDPMG